MTPILDQLPELLKDKIPREQDRKLLIELITIFQKSGTRATKQAIAEKITKIAEVNP